MSIKKNLSPEQKLMEKKNENLTQEDKVHKTLLKAKGKWVSGNYFLHTMLLSQYHRAIFNLEHRDGVKIEHSEHRDQYGFKEYRIIPKN